MIEGVHHTAIPGEANEKISLNDIPMSPSEFESILMSMVPGLPYEEGFLEERLQKIDIIPHVNPLSVNPTVYWHVAQLIGDEGDDSLRFSVALKQFYPENEKGKLMTGQALLQNVQIGIERYREDLSLSIELFFLTSGKFVGFSMYDFDDVKSLGSIGVTINNGVESMKGSMRQFGLKIMQLPSIRLDTVISHFVQIDQPLNLGQAFGLLQ